MRLKTIHIEFTTACNSRCIMCDYWINGKSQTIDSSLVFSLVAQQYTLGLESLYFTGGECLLSAQQLFPLCRRLRKAFPDLRLGLITNGLLVHGYWREIADVFQKVIISLDALDPVKYKKIRGVDGIATVQKGIRLLKEYSPKTKVNLRVLVLQDNLDELSQIVQYAKIQKLDRVSFIAEDTSSTAFGRTKPIYTNDYRPFPIIKLRREIEQIKMCFSDQVGNLLRQGLEDLEWVYNLYAGDSLHFPTCDKAVNSCVISANGIVSPCFFIHGTKHLSTDISLLDILNSEEYRQQVHRILAYANPFCCKCVCPKKLS